VTRWIEIFDPVLGQWARFPDSLLDSLPPVPPPDHGALPGLGDDDHAQYHNDTRGDLRYAPIGSGVTNGDSHDHAGGDGAQIAYSGLSGLPTLGSIADNAESDFAVAAKGVTNGDSHDHAAGDGAQIDHGGLAGLADDDHAQYAPKADPTFTTKITTPQVQFPASQSASSDPNNLDDYEEGTWTTTVSAVTNFTGTPTLSDGRYTKVGNLVSLQGKFSGTVTTANLLTYFAFTIPFSPAHTTAGAAFQGGGVRAGNSYVEAGAGGFLFFPPPSAIVAGADNFFFEVTYRV